MKQVTDTFPFLFSEQEPISCRLGNEIALYIQTLVKQALHASANDIKVYFIDRKGITAQQFGARMWRDVPSELEEAKRLLRLALPHISPRAIDAEKSKTHKIDECYINTSVREFLQKTNK